MNTIISKLSFLIRCIAAMIKLQVFSMKDKGKDKDKSLLSDTSNYIISLTSYNRRFKTLHLTLESLFRQSSKPLNIFLWLSQEDVSKFGGVPWTVRKYERYGLVIKVFEENIKSYKKLSYIESVLSAVSNIELVITADDDIMYPHDWAEKLIFASKKYCAVSCYRGHDLVFDGFSYNYNTSMLRNLSYSKPAYRLLPTGCSGICYPRGAINQIVNDRRFLEYAPDADDLWYKAMSLISGFKCVRVEDENIHFPLIISSLFHTLYIKNVHQSENEKKLIDTFSLFDLERYFK